MLEVTLVSTTFAILIYQFRKYFSRNVFVNIFKLLLFYVFFFGVVESLNPPNFVLKFTIDLFLFTGIIFLIEKQNTTFSGKVYFLLFSVFYIFSVLFNNSAIYHSATFFRIFFYPYLVFLITVNLKLNEKNWQKLNLFLISLFLVQIIFSVIKFFLVGITEKVIIGSVTTSGGTISTMLPLFAICFLLSYYLHYRKTFYLLLIFGFLFMGFVGAKRGIWFYFPVLMLISAYLYNRVNKTNILNIKSFRYMIMAFFLVPLVLYLGSRYNRTLNPDESIGGEFDLGYAGDYALEYTFNESEYSDYTHGRGANFIRVLQRMSQGNPINFFFGHGPDAAKGVTTYGQGIWGEFRIRGPVPGFPTHFVQIGIFCVLIVLLAFRKMFTVFVKIYKTTNNPGDKIYAFGGALAIILFLIDYLTYSSSFLATIFPISFSLFYVLGYLMNRNRRLG